MLQNKHNTHHLSLALWVAIDVFYLLIRQKRMMKREREGMKRKRTFNDDVTHPPWDFPCTTTSHIEDARTVSILKQ